MIDSTLFLLIGTVLGALLAGLGVYFIVRPKAQMLEDIAKKEAEKTIKNAEEYASKLQKDADKKAYDIQNRAENEEKRVLQKLDNKEKELDKRILEREKELDNKRKKLDESKDTYEKAHEEVVEKKKELDKLIHSEQDKLSEVAKLSSEDAKKRLFDSIELECNTELANTYRKKIALVKENVDTDAAHILVEAMQRYASQTTNETVLTVVKLESEEMKGKIIGREGRNISAFEMITGVDVIVDDAPQTITLSSFDTYRRYIAKMVLEEMLKDGKINPARIEQLVEKAEQSGEQLLIQLGKKAEEELDILGAFPDEVLRLVGKLRFRSSYGQNVLRHSIEVAFLGAALGEHLEGADTVMLKKAGLVHDIGKAVSHEVEGGHALIGRDILQKYGVTKPIIQAMQSHHEDVPYETLESRILQAADAISASRPGARRETLEKYIKRLQQLEGISSSFPGVQKAFALQAGREVRVFVNAREMSDLEAEKLSFNLARTIEKECQYPGEVLVHVIRERRYKEVAR